ncbi:MAG TPA: hypothetical protein VHZ02_04495 [Acidimicrobiales bacterium]|nr:hypothetical protein [Acidimicrobiales bacterium]
MGGEAARLQIPDQRDSGRHLRVSWHPTRQLVVFSHWRDGVCVATTPVELAEVPAVIAVLVKALADASRWPTAKGAMPNAQSVVRDARDVMSTWLRPRLATIVALKPRSSRRCD